jgi:cytosine/adenosine deaminase-related metal-dependent hydrolase
MDRHSPDDYIEATADGLRDAEEFVTYTLGKKCSRIQPCITPRFIPTCTPELMKGELRWPRRLKRFRPLVYFDSLVASTIVLVFE